MVPDREWAMAPEWVMAPQTKYKNGLPVSGEGATQSKEGGNEGHIRAISESKRLDSTSEKLRECIVRLKHSMLEDRTQAAPSV